MRRIWIYAGALLAVFALAAGSGAVRGETAAPAPNRTELTRSYTLPYRIVQARASAAMEAAMLALTNQSREAAGLPPLSASTRLRSVARLHGSDMFAHGYLSHQSRDGLLPLARVEAAGLAPWRVGENLAYAPNVPEAHRLLINSPGHRANILSPVYRRVGIGVMDGGQRGVIVVEDFTD